MGVEQLYVIGRKEETMTRNQIMWWELQESKRHNRVGESLTDFANQTGRTDVQNKFALGNTANQIQATHVANQYDVGNRQAQAALQTAAANASQAATAAARIPILQFEAEIKDKHNELIATGQQIERERNIIESLKAGSQAIQAGTDNQRMKNQHEENLLGLSARYDELSAEILRIEGQINRWGNQNTTDILNVLVNGIVPFAQLGSVKKLTGGAKNAQPSRTSLDDLWGN
jgi:hypothetical protein